MVVDAVQEIKCDVRIYPGSPGCLKRAYLALPRSRINPTESGRMASS